MLEVKNVGVFYGDLQVLWDVSLRIDKGEIATLIGSNGAGKTTLCKTIIGALPPKNGSITFMEKRIDGLQIPDIVRLGISIVPEGRRLFGNMTVRENLELGAYAGKNRERIGDTMEWIFNLFPVLRERQNQLAGCMSGGEQQMLAIARGLMAKPKFLILDEPSLGLAPKLVLKVYDLIEKIRSEGVTLLLVEQYARHALEKSDKGFLLENGRLILEGPSEKLLKDERVRKAYLGEE
ncbi:MAG: ABC transporter ATP-binding protein [Candidatus Bathyarchaeota archaeon]|nr:ABC transporter ATP-binding protein [Candidatus Bathyarchaeota archaeon]